MTKYTPFLSVILSGLLLPAILIPAHRTWMYFPEEDRFRHLIMAEAARQNVDPALVMGMIAQESGFKWWAVSPSGARGLMQIMPATAGWACPDLPHYIEEPAQNVRCGVRYLSQQLTTCSGRIVCALWSYNAGPGSTARAGGTPPTEQARDYALKVAFYYRGYSSKVIDHFWVQSSGSPGLRRYFLSR